MVDIKKKESIKSIGGSPSFIRLTFLFPFVSYVTLMEHTSEQEQVIARVPRLHTSIHLQSSALGMEEDVTPPAVTMMSFIHTFSQ